MNISYLISSFRLSAHIRKNIERVISLFYQADNAVSRFQKQTALACLPECGKCCEQPYIETTVLEMLPVALHIFNEKKEGYWIDLLTKGHLPPICIFYQKDPVVPDKGRCRMYLFRPIICRLYGFAGRKAKDGTVQFFTCPKIQHEHKEQVKFAQQLVNHGKKIAIMSDFQWKVFSYDPFLGGRRLPINRALLKALEYIGLHVRYKKETSPSRYQD